MRMQMFLEEEGKDLRKEILMENHEALQLFAGHFTPKMMFKKLSQYYYWPGMRANVQKVCGNCIVCFYTGTGVKEETTIPLHTSWATILMCRDGLQGVRHE